MKIGLIITAAGESVRFGKNKLLEVIGNKSILEHVVNSFAAFPTISERVITLSTANMAFAQTQSFLVPYKIICGGSARALSVKKAFNALAPCDIVLVHDAARPFVPKAVIERLIHAYQQGHNIVIPTQSLTDTIKKINLKNEVIQTVDRNTLVSVQTPQLFGYELLKDVYKNIEEDILESGTDEAMLCESLGHKVYAELGDEMLRKVTTPQDIKLLEYLCSLRTYPATN